MTKDTKVRYQICAEMSANHSLKIPSGITLWLGLHHENLPGWTQREEAFCFHSVKSAQDCFRNGRGYAHGMYKPKTDTVMICEHVVVTVISETFRPIVVEVNDPECFHNILFSEDIRETSMCC